MSFTKIKTLAYQKGGEVSDIHNDAIHNWTAMK